MNEPRNLNQEERAREAFARQAVHEQAVMDSGSWWHSIELGDSITPGLKTLPDLRENYASFQLPAGLTGKRILDIGCWDGFYGFEAEQNGGQVVAIDCFRPETFFHAHKARRSKIEFRELSVYEVNRRELGGFDFVLFLGVLYHLRHPLLGLERVCEVTDDFAVIESHVTDDFFADSHPVMEFYEFDQLGGRYDNWWGPSSDCLIQMVRSAGFARVEVLGRKSSRVLLKAYRCWKPNPQSESTPSLEVSRVFNPISWTPDVPTCGRNAFLGMYVRGLPESVTRESLHLHVGRFGIKPHFIGDSEYPGFKQINAPVPPGLSPGSAAVWLESGNQRSNETEVHIVEGGPW